MRAVTALRRAAVGPVVVLHIRLHSA